EQELAAVRAHPRSGKAWGKLGLLFRAHDFGPPATECLNMAMQLDPQEFLWPYVQGVALAVSDTGASAANLERAAALRPREPLPRLRLGELYLGEGRIDDATAEFRAALAFDPNNARGLLGMSRCSLSRGDLEESRRLAAEAVRFA